jgi:hypothetical protein
MRAYSMASPGSTVNFIYHGLVPGVVGRKKALEVRLQRRASLQRGEAGQHRDRVLRVERRRRGGVEAPDGPDNEEPTRQAARCYRRTYVLKCRNPSYLEKNITLGMYR